MAAVASPRRRPKFGSFLVTGAVIGFVLGSILALIGPQDNRYSASTSIGFLGLLGAGIGALVGAVVAILIDRRA